MYHNHLMIEHITPRELEVLNLIGCGLSNQEIADTLIIATTTVKKYAANIYGKLGVKRRTQAVVVARDLQIL